MLKNIFVEHSQISHEDLCDFMIILCPSCKDLMRVNERERHNERECPERTLYCKYCKEPFQLKNIKVRLVSLESDLQPNVLINVPTLSMTPGHCVQDLLNDCGGESFVLGEFHYLHIISIVKMGCQTNL